MTQTHTYLCTNC